MRVPDLAVPVSAWVAQISAPDIPGVPPEGPQWFAGLLAGVFLILWLLDRYGKLPGAAPAVPPPRPLMSEDDRKGITKAVVQVDAIHRIVSREDRDKPGWHMVWNPSEDERQKNLEVERQFVAAAGEALAEIKDAGRVAAVTVETLRAMQGALHRMHQKQDEIDEKLNQILGRAG